MFGSRVANRTEEEIRRHPAPSDVTPSRLFPALAGLWALAVSQPLVDLMARQPQFLVAHGLSPAEVVVVALLIVTLPAVVLGASAFASRLGVGAVGGVVAVPVGLILLYVGGRLGLGGLPLVAGALGMAVGLAALYVRSRSAQELSRYLGVVPVAVLAYFFVVLPGAVLAGADGDSAAAIVQVTNPVPIVVVVLDELPLASLIDPEGRLLAEQFPSFGRLATDGVWYRNAITVETRTTESIPAILSGTLVPDGLVPNAANHPRTLMTMLADSHDVATVEPVTELCPRRVCPLDPDQGAPAGWATLVSDLLVVYGHLVVPAPWTDRLPAIDQNWTGFATGRDAESWELVEAVGEAVEEDRRGEVARFVSSLQFDGERPLLRVAHLVLPHRPWEFLPDGTRHGQENPEGYGQRAWGDDEFFVAEGWRRHLLQVGYTDTALGRVIERLEREGLYESSLIVVVADHGVHFAPGVADMRVTDRDSLWSILPVPLFIKYPAGLSAAPPPGAIDDRRAETTDVVPTVLDAMGADIPPTLDGVSLLTPFVRAGSELELRGEPFPVDVDGAKAWEAARRKDFWFPGGDVWSLVPEPSLRSLLGKEVIPMDDPRLELELSVGAPVPPLIEGSITLEGGSLGGNPVVLTAGDGSVIALSKPFDVEGSVARFSFLVDPTGGHDPPFAAYLLLSGVPVG